VGCTWEQVHWIQCLPEDGRKDAMGEQGSMIQSTHEVLPQRQRRKKKARDASKDDHEDGGDKLEGVSKRNRLLNEKEEASVGQDVDGTVEINEDQKRQEIKNSDGGGKEGLGEALEGGGVEKETVYNFECMHSILLVLFLCSRQCAP